MRKKRKVGRPPKVKETKMEYELFCVSCAERMQQEEDMIVRVLDKDIGEHKPHVIWICPKCETEIIVFFGGALE